MPPSVKVLAEQLLKLSRRSIDDAFKPLYDSAPVEAPDLYALVESVDRQAWQANPVDALYSAIATAAGQQWADEPVASRATLTLRQVATAMFNLDRHNLDHVDGHRYNYLLQEAFTADDIANNLMGDDRKKVTKKVRTRLAQALLELADNQTPTDTPLLARDTADAEPPFTFFIPDLDQSELTPEDTHPEPSRQPRALPLLPDHELEQAAISLAETMRTIWEDEEEHRRLSTPPPLQVYWVDITDYVMNKLFWIYGIGSQSAESIDLDGTLNEIVDTFNKVPSRRLVVLGDAGSGKSTLALQFMRDAFADWTRPDHPVPVLFPMSNWNPAKQTLRDWMTSQLASNYVAPDDYLSKSRGGRKKEAYTTTIAGRLLNGGWILPIFDGFDEIAPNMRSDALEQISKSSAVGNGFLLTSRPEEYMDTLKKCPPLPTAAILRIQDLNIGDIAPYLSGTLNKRWGAVVKRLQDVASSTEVSDTPARVLLDALSTPFMVSLAREIYGETGTDPKGLLRFPDVASVHDHLLDAYIPAVYKRPRTQSQKQTTRSLSKTWRPDDAQRWLGNLALHMHSLDLAYFPWWELARALPRLPLRDRNDWPSTFRNLSWGYRREFFWKLLLQSATVAAIGAVVGLVYVLIGLLRGKGFDAPTIGIGALLSLVILSCPVFTIVSVTYIDHKEATSPQAVAVATRRTELTRALLFWYALPPPIGWLIFARALFVLATGKSTLAAGIVVGLGPLIFLVMLTYSVWGEWVRTRAWFALTGQLPWSLMKFLEDAHKRGVLRQVGSLYQFRHALLQDRLAYHALRRQRLSLFGHRKRIHVLYGLINSWLYYGQLGLAESGCHELIDSKGRRIPWIPIVGFSSRCHVLLASEMLADLLVRRGRCIEAVAAYRELLGSYQIAYNRTHTTRRRHAIQVYTWRTKLCLVRTLLGVRQGEEARQEYEEFMTAIRESVPEGDGIMLTANNALGYFDRGNNALSKLLVSLEALIKLVNKY